MPIIPIFQSPFAYAIPDIIAGLTSAQSEATGWNTLVRDAEEMVVVRTSDTVITITLNPVADYDITAQETITATVPANALENSAISIVATSTFTIDVVTIEVPIIKFPRGKTLSAVDVFGSTVVDVGISGSTLVGVGSAGKTLADPT